MGISFGVDKSVHGISFFYEWNEGGLVCLWIGVDEERVVVGLEEHGCD